MTRRKKFLPHLLIALLSLAGLLLFINTFNPYEPFEIGNLKTPAVIPFFFLAFLAVGGISIFVLGNIRRGILVALFLVTFLLLQYLSINNLIYSTVLLIIILLLELLFWKKKKK